MGSREVIRRLANFSQVKTMSLTMKTWTKMVMKKGGASFAQGSIQQPDGVRELISGGAAKSSQDSQGQSDSEDWGSEAVQDGNKYSTKSAFEYQKKMDAHMKAEQAAAEADRQGEDLHMQKQKQKQKNKKKELKDKKRAAAAKKKAAQDEKREPVAPQEDHHHVTRQILYVRNDDGSWHVQKELIATKDHPILNPQPLALVVDEGIPIQERMAEDSDEDHDEGSDSDSAKDASSNLMQMDGPHLHQRFDKAAFLKEQKHALSEEMKWRLKEKARQEKEQKELNAKKQAIQSSVAMTQVDGPHLHQHFDKSKFLKEQKHALSDEMKWRLKEKSHKEKAPQHKSHFIGEKVQTGMASGLLQETPAMTPAMAQTSRLAKLKEQLAEARKAEKEQEEKEYQMEIAMGKKHGSTTLEPIFHPRYHPEDADEDKDPESFFQVSQQKDKAVKDSDDSKTSQNKHDDALAEAAESHVMYVTNKLSKADQQESEALEVKREAAEKWRDAANPVEEYDGPMDPKSFSELSKRRSLKEQSYDGMQAVASGFWAEDRPNERRVDLSDKKVYTWAQYRLKYPFKHSWTVEDMWKDLPTEKRVKQLGKKAFIRRFR